MDRRRWRGTGTTQGALDGGLRDTELARDVLARHATGDRSCDLLAALMGIGRKARGQEQQLATEVGDQPLGNVAAEDVDQAMLVGQGGGT